MDTILVANAGSSSVKFQLFGIDVRGELVRQLKGQVEGVGTKPRLRAVDAKGTALLDRSFGPEAIPDVTAALNAAGAWLRDDLDLHPIAVGHRVVHGGPYYDRPVRADAQVIERLEKLIPLAPLHQPYNLAPVRALLKNRPDTAQVVCFDTAFHRNHDPVADYYAIPRALYEEGVRRYGFHGLSYEYIASALPGEAPQLAQGRVIVAHLGSGASICAIANGRSVDSSLGFTALDGLPMGTRPGQLDPGVVLYLLSEKGMTPAQVQDFLYRECGLKGLSGISNDLRELQASADVAARFAIDHFVYRIALYAGMMAAALQGVDGFVFTAGIGENSALIRRRVIERLRWLGAALDVDANEAGRKVISAPDSRLPVYVLPTDEELMIARHTLKLV